MSNRILAMFLSGLFILAGSVAAQAAVTAPVTDSIPASNKKPITSASDKPEESTTAKADETIKEVPKSRKQARPLAVTAVTVQPVTVKPKIIVRPVIKVHL